MALAGDEVERGDAEFEEGFFDDFDEGFLEGEGTFGIEVGLRGGVEVYVFDIEVDEEGAMVVEGAGGVELILEEPVEVMGGMEGAPGVGDAVAAGEVGAGGGGRIIGAAHELDKAFADMGTVSAAGGVIAGRLLNGGF
jgi:hypothetical protein